MTYIVWPVARQISARAFGLRNSGRWPI